MAAEKQVIKAEFEKSERIKKTLESLAEILSYKKDPQINTYKLSPDAQHRVSLSTDFKNFLEENKVSLLGLHKKEGKDILKYKNINEVKLEESLNELRELQNIKSEIFKDKPKFQHAAMEIVFEEAKKSGIDLPLRYFNDKEIKEINPEGKSIVEDPYEALPNNPNIHFYINKIVVAEGTATGKEIKENEETKENNKKFSKLSETLKQKGFDNEIMIAMGENPDTMSITIKSNDALKTLIKHERSKQEERPDFLQNIISGEDKGKGEGHSK